MKSLSLSTRMIAASVVLAVLVAGVFAVLVYAVVTRLLDWRGGPGAARGLSPLRRRSCRNPG